MSKKTTSGIFSLWLNWVVATGLVNVAVFLAPWVTGPWMALLVFCLAIVLVIYMRGLRLRGIYNCGMINWLELRTLMVSALIMLLITVFFVKGYAANIYGEESLNPSRPFITILVMAPVTFCFAIWILIRGNNNVFCRYCSARYGDKAERGFIGTIYSHEGMVQVKVLTLLTGVISVITWVYYWLAYVNVSFNGTDTYFLTLMPLFLWLCTVVYFSIRYFSLWGFYRQNSTPDSPFNGESTIFRFLVLYENQILLQTEETDVQARLPYLDTPAYVHIRHFERPTLVFAQKVLTDMSGIPIDAYRIRFMYGSEAYTGHTNVFHYIVVLNDAEVMKNAIISGQFFNLAEIQLLLENGNLNPMLNAELARLYYITMAWKTYDSHGRRLYHVKNYKPAFRLNGIIDWDVNFDDSQWMEIASNNEDHLWFRVRRFWNKLIGHLH